MAGQHEAGEASSTPQGGDTISPSASRGATREAIEAARAESPGRPAAARRPGRPAIGRQRVAVLICVSMAAVMVATAVIGIGKLPLIPVVLDFAAAVVWLVAGWLLLSSGVRWPAVTIGWLTAAGMILELGDYQSAKNASGSLEVATDNYFLPGLLWLYMFGLIVVAIVVGVLSKRPERPH